MNKVILIGRLAADPELRTTQSGKPVAQYRLAVNRRFVNAQGVREADFFNCVAWNEKAEFVAKHLSKGVKIAVSGTLQNRSYDAQDGSKRYVTEVIVDEHDFCDSKGAGGYQEQSAPAPEPPSGYNGGGFTQVEDDELPF